MKMEVKIKQVLGFARQCLQNVDFKLFDEYLKINEFGAAILELEILGMSVGADKEFWDYLEKARQIFNKNCM